MSVYAESDTSCLLTITLSRSSLANFKHQGLDVDIEMSRYAGGVVRKLLVLKAAC